MSFACLGSWVSSHLGQFLSPCPWGSCFVSYSSLWVCLMGFFFFFSLTRLRLCVLGITPSYHGSDGVPGSGYHIRCCVNYCSLLLLYFTYVPFFFFFNRLRVCGSPASGASVALFFQQRLLTVFLCQILAILTIFQLFLYYICFGCL